MSRFIAIATVLTLSGAALADAPSQDAVKSVWDHYLKGQGGGAVLGEFVACLEVDTKRKSETAFECVKKAEGTVPKDTKLYAWTAWLVPKGDEHEFMVQYKHNGVVRSTKDQKVKGKLIRNRTYTYMTARKAGTWEIVIMSGGKEVGSASVTVE